jgi:hypothetical protein
MSKYGNMGPASVQEVHFLGILRIKGGKHNVVDAQPGEGGPREGECVNAFTRRAELQASR